MDLRLFFRILWRFRVLMAVGVLVAGALALLSYAHISIKDSRPKLEYRQAESWTTSSTILVTQPGFPLGRSISTGVIPLDPSDPSAGSVPRYANPGDLAGFAVLYAALAGTDPVQAIMRRSGPIPGTYTATAVTTPANSSIALPFVRFVAFATTPERAMRTAVLASRALIEYIRSQQDAAHISPDTRVVLSPVQKVAPPQLFKGRSLSRPIAAFVVLLLLFAGLAFALENVRPRVSRRLALTNATQDETPEAATIRHTA